MQDTKVIDGYAVFLALLAKLGGTSESTRIPNSNENAILAIGKCVLWEGAPDYWARISTGEQTKERKNWNVEFSDTREKIEDRYNWESLFKLSFERYGNHPSTYRYKAEAITTRRMGQLSSIDATDLRICRAIGKILEEWAAVGATFNLDTLPTK